MSRIRTARNELKATALLAGPVVAAQLAQMSMGFIDTVMVGRLGPEALAGVALGHTLFFFLFVVCAGVIAAVGPMVSQAYGAGEHEPITRSVRQGLWLALVLAIPVMVILWQAGPLLRLLGQEEVAAAEAAGYLRAIMWGGLPLLAFASLRSFVEGLARPLPVTAITAAGVVLNIGANYVLMFGAFGVPALGIVGTGWASTIVYWFMLGALALFVYRVEPFRDFPVFSGLRSPDPAYFRELFRIGWPIGVTFGIESGLFMITAMMMGWLGTTALAAHQIALQCAAFTFMVPLGIGIATSVRTGQAAGRRAPAAVRRAGLSGIFLATLFMTGAAVLFWTMPETIVSLYIDAGAAENVPVAELAATLLGIAAVFQLFDGLQVAAAGALRGLKDTRMPMVIGLVAYWGVGLSLGYVLGFVEEGGAPGLWWGLVAGLTVAAVLLTVRFMRQTVEVAEVDVSPASSTLLVEESREEVRKL